MVVAPALYKTCRVTLLYSADTSSTALWALEQNVGVESWEWNEVGDTRQPIAVSDISVYICLIVIRSKSKEQLSGRRAGLSTRTSPHACGPAACVSRSRRLPYRSSFH